MILVAVKLLEHGAREVTERWRKTYPSSPTEDAFVFPGVSSFRKLTLARGDAKRILDIAG